VGREFPFRASRRNKAFAGAIIAQKLRFLGDSSQVLIADVQIGSEGIRAVNSTETQVRRTNKN
jgi:hypothetical protein